MITWKYTCWLSDRLFLQGNKGLDCLDIHSYPCLTSLLTGQRKINNPTCSCVTVTRKYQELDSLEHLWHMRVLTTVYPPSLSTAIIFKINWLTRGRPDKWHLRARGGWRCAEVCLVNVTCQQHRIGVHQMLIPNNECTLYPYNCNAAYLVTYHTRVTVGNPDNWPYIGRARAVMTSHGLSIIPVSI